MRMLVVAPEPVFTPRGTPFSVYHRLAIAAELGVEADLLTYEEGADPDLPGLTIHRIPRLPFLRPVRIGPSIGKLIRDVFMVAWTVGLLIRRRPDVVHAHEEAIFWCRALKPVFGYRLIYDMHSSLPQQLTNFEFTSSRAIVGLFAWLENSALEASDAVLTISPALAAVARERMSDPSRHALLENSVLDPVRLKEEPGGAPDGVPGSAGSSGADEAAGPAWPSDWSDASVVLYAGTLEPYQGIELLLEAFRIVRVERPDARLVVLGGSPEQVDHYRRLAGSLGLDDVARLPGSVNQPAARRLMARAGTLVSPRTRGTNTPLKVYELLNSGKPFVATRIESHTQVLDESVCILADPDPESFAAGILTSLRGGPQIAERVAGAKRLYRTDYGRDAYREKFARILGKVAPPGETFGLPVSGESA